MQVVLVKHRDYGNVQYYDPADKEYKRGELVIIDEEKNRDYGTVVKGNHEPEQPVSGNLLKIVRAVNPFDQKKIEENSFREKKAFKFCLESIRRRGLPMNLIGVEYSFDRKKLKFMFTSAKKVDFRELVKELVEEFKIGVELRQIGVRDAAKILGGLGVCGLMVCCHRHLCKFETVNLKMARAQNILSSPDKISGSCGRLRCCLRYELDDYAQKACMTGCNGDGHDEEYSEHEES